MMGNIPKHSIQTSKQSTIHQSTNEEASVGLGSFLCLVFCAVCVLSLFPHHIPCDGGRPYPEVTAAFLPSSLETSHSFALLYSSRLPVSVCGTVKSRPILEVFLESLICPIPRAARKNKLPKAQCPKIQTKHNFSKHKQRSVCVVWEVCVLCFVWFFVRSVFCVLFLRATHGLRSSFDSPLKAESRICLGFIFETRTSNPIMRTAYSTSSLHRNAPRSWNINHVSIRFGFRHPLRPD